MGDEYAARHKHEVVLEDDHSLLVERWHWDSDMRIDRKFLQIQDLGEWTSVRFMTIFKDKAMPESQGMLVPTALFRQFARWAARTGR